MPINSMDYALVIGLNDYPDYGANGRSLKGAIRDAEEITKWLRDKDLGGGLPDENVILITSKSVPLSPHQFDIDDALKVIVKQSKGKNPRRLYFYFSGHGHVSGETRHDVALCLPHWSRDNRNAALSSSRYLDYIQKCTDFEEIVMLLDCCRVQQVAAVGKQSDMDCPLPMQTNRSVLIAYASEHLRPAFEATGARGEIDSEIDEVVDEIRGHFTEALLAGLRAGAARIEGGVTAHDLKRYLEVNVERIAKASGHQQKPQIPLDMDDNTANNMIFGCATPVANVEICFSARRKGVVELIGPTGEVMKSDVPSTGPWQFRLEKGLYMLSEQLSGETHTIRFIPSTEVMYVEF